MVSGPAGTELFVYWKVAGVDWNEAVSALRLFQRGLALGARGLEARLLRRADEPASGVVTLMEIYALPGNAGGVHPALRREIVEVGDTVSAPWRQGPRHVEMFVAAGETEGAGPPLQP
jgi:Domain of unknown function (DUF4936)